MYNTVTRLWRVGGVDPFPRSEALFISTDNPVATAYRFFFLHYYVP